MSEPKEIGSLLDILPKPNTPEFDRLPGFVQREVEQLRRGERPMSRAAVSEAEIVPRRIDLLANEIRNIAEQLVDIRQGQRDFDNKATPILNDLRLIVKEHSTRIASHDERHAAHDKRFEQHGTKLLAHEAKHIEHEAKHVETSEHITGVFKRLVVLETAVVQIPKPRPRKKKRK